jgi:hypothetical protein
VLDAVRLGPGDDETAPAAAQLREVVERLRDGDPPVVIVLDACPRP